MGSRRNGPSLKTAAELLRSHGFDAEKAGKSVADDIRSPTQHRQLSAHPNLVSIDDRELSRQIFLAQLG